MHTRSRLFWVLLVLVVSCFSASPRDRSCRMMPRLMEVQAPLATETFASERVVRLSMATASVRYLSDCETPPEDRQVEGLHGQGLLCGEPIGEDLMAFCLGLRTRVVGLSSRFDGHDCRVDLPVTKLATFRTYDGGSGERSLFCVVGASTAKFVMVLHDETSAEPSSRSRAADAGGTPMVSRRIYSYELRIEGTEICGRHGGDDVEQGLAIALTARDQALRIRARRAISGLSSAFWRAIQGNQTGRVTLDCLEDPIDAISHH